MTCVTPCLAIIGQWTNAELELMRENTVLDYESRTWLFISVLAN